ncbi:MAG TPA: GAF and ANTAR domain-containing protein [Actinomycetota bacterium]|nr:GAF and ANTAR domain-containing protein [Actinomycetota bacterium]
MADLRAACQVDDPLADAFDRLSGFVLTEHCLDSALQLVIDLASSALKGTEAAGISLKKGTKVFTAVSTGQRAVELDELQYDLGDGPCLQAMRDGEMQLTQSLISEQRWPQYTSRALYAGAMSILALPVQAGGQVLGALNFYSSREQAFSETDLAVARAFTDRSAVVLLNAKIYEEASELAAQMQEALASRAVIDQAKGIIMVTEKVSAEVAFKRLKSLSQAANVKVRDLARRIVEEASGATADQVQRVS